MALSFAQKLLRFQRPVVLFHTWTVTRELLGQAIREQRSMDLDVCVDDRGDPYLGHTKEYHEKTREPFFNSMPLREPVEARGDSNIPVIIDSNHSCVWHVADEALVQLRPVRCV